VTADGKTHTVATLAARGSAANPLKDAEIEEKLRIEADSWQKGHDIQPPIDAVARSIGARRAVAGEACGAGLRGSVGSRP
jgi:hypothetical protein